MLQSWSRCSCGHLHWACTGGCATVKHELGNSTSGLAPPWWTTDYEHITRDGAVIVFSYATSGELTRLQWMVRNLGSYSWPWFSTVGHNTNLKRKRCCQDWKGGVKGWVVKMIRMCAIHGGNCRRTELINNKRVGKRRLGHVTEFLQCRKVWGWY